MAKTEAKTENVAVANLRKGALAYVGLYGLAYERAQFRADQLKTKSSELFETLVKKGEVLEGKGLELTKEYRTKANELVGEGVETVRNVVPFGSNDNRVEELEAEISALNKKIVAMGKKATTAAKSKAKLKTEKTEKAA